MRRIALLITLLAMAGCDKTIHEVNAPTGAPQAIALSR